MLKTRLNGGETSLQEVADAWHKEKHEFGWSQFESDAWAIEFVKKINKELEKNWPAKPDPRNIHEG